MRTVEDARDALFAPRAAQLRPVPACEACADALDAGRLQQLRRVLVDGRPQPYWRGPAHVGYAGRGPITTREDLLGPLATTHRFPSPAPSGLASSS